MKVPNVLAAEVEGSVSLSRLQNEGSQPQGIEKLRAIKSIKATE